MTVTPEILVAHNETLLTQDAVYPFYKWVTHVQTVPRGQYAVTVNEPFQSRCPTKLYVCLVSAEAFNGNYQKNAYHLQNYGIRSAAFLKNNQSWPDRPLEMDFVRRELTNAYESLLKTAGKSDSQFPFDIGMKRFQDGFTILAFDLESTASDALDYVTETDNAHTAL